MLEYWRKVAEPAFTVKPSSLRRSALGCPFCGTFCGLHRHLPKFREVRCLTFVSKRGNLALNCPVREQAFGWPSCKCYSQPVPQRRNLGGPRREASERLGLRPSTSGSDPAGDEIIAWTLNVSRGGLRLIVEETVEAGACYVVTMGEGEPRLATVVWTREEADGQIAGLKFDDVEGGEIPSSTPPAP